MHSCKVNGSVCNFNICIISFKHIHFWAFNCHIKYVIKVTMTKHTYTNRTLCWRCVRQVFSPLYTCLWGVCVKWMTSVRPKSTARCWCWKCSEYCRKFPQYFRLVIALKIFTNIVAFPYFIICLSPFWLIHRLVINIYWSYVNILSCFVMILFILPRTELIHHGCIKCFCRLYKDCQRLICYLIVHFWGMIFCIDTHMRVVRFLKYL